MHGTIKPNQQSGNKHLQQRVERVTVNRFFYFKNKSSLLVGLFTKPTRALFDTFGPSRSFPKIHFYFQFPPAIQQMASATNLRYSLTKTASWAAIGANA
jgi:hypothetical protein